MKKMQDTNDYKLTIINQLIFIRLV